MSELEYALNTFYLLVSGAFVMWMAAGFTMLEAGLVRAKNVSEIVTKNLGLYSIACVMYLVCGFFLMYPGDSVYNAYFPMIGSTWGMSLDGLTFNTDLGYSDAADFFFQVVFVATAMSIISGAVAERMKLIPFFLFAIVLTGFIYPVQGYWKWGGGWLDAIGYTDFAGSGVVHLCGAAAALAAVIILGPRTGKYGSDGSIKVMRGSNIPIAALGALILWLGWFGFNGGSQLAVNDAANANAVATAIEKTLPNGSKNVKKIIDNPIKKRGITNHRVNGNWICGGASNAGCGILSQFFSDLEIKELSRQINPSKNTSLNLLPLNSKGERFPVNDSDLKPILGPRPVSDSLYLHALFEGLAKIELKGWEKLGELTGSLPKKIITIGGGSKNPQWRKIREKIINITIVSCNKTTSFGTALLAINSK